ncbi:ImmA/IrrE family metallo-endopeptidase [Coprococcus comes]|uniref:ImmA/IrrE family metallo-endopeptidase n=1 Tax=Coprococcus comes TaxID=410072 RepID=UPI003F8B1549
MTMDYICREVERLKRKFHETDPFLLCDAMGIILLYEPMGTYPGACKGFFLAQSRKRSITVNSDLPEAIQRIIVTHELGHAVLHAKAVGVKAFHDFELFDSTSLMEYEANIFAAEFLMDDDDVLEKLNEDISFFGAASLLRVPPELLDFKFRLMKRNGYKLIDPPLMANSNFLKNVETEVTDEY